MCDILIIGDDAIDETAFGWIVNECFFEFELLVLGGVILFGGIEGFVDGLEVLHELLFEDFLFFVVLRFRVVDGIGGGLGMAFC